MYIYESCTDVTQLCALDLFDVYRAVCPFTKQPLSAMLFFWKAF